MPFPRYLHQGILLLILVSLPFFEGGESPFGLFLIHSLTLFLAGLLLWNHSKLWIPRFLIYFLPLLLSCLIGTLLAGYHYAAMLELWDLGIAGFFSFAVFTTFRESEPDHAVFLRIAFFCLAAACLISFALINPFHGNRLTGSFVNPNDFGSFGLLLVLFGIALFERESAAVRKLILLLLILVLGVSVFLALSRSVFLASGVIFAIYLWKKRPGRALTAALLLILVVGSSLVAPRFLPYADPFQYYRLRIWANSLKAVLQNPYLGIGPNMLPYYAPSLSFPADVEVGRYARIATSADNQYFQILIETGFVGFFSFLIGWLALFFALRQEDKRFLPCLLAYLAISLIGIFGLPLFCTSILFLLLFLVLVPISLNPGQSIELQIKTSSKVLFSILLLLLFVLTVLFPYWGHREFAAAVSAKDPESAQMHLSRATRLNPYQPYYSFHFLKPLVDAGPDLGTEAWLDVLDSLDHIIHLNPQEPDFYVARAKALRILYTKTGRIQYATEGNAAYQSALILAPNNVFLRGEFADFEKRLGHDNLAIHEVQRMIELEPAFLNGHYMMAELRFRAGESAVARSAFAQAEKLERRYRNYPLSKGDRYGRRLLNVNVAYKQKVKDLIFGHDQE